MASRLPYTVGNLDMTRACCLLLLAGTTLLGQDQVAAQRGVARLSIVNGDVSIQRGDSDTRSAAAVNAPLMAGDVVAAGQGGRAEIQFDAANMGRLDSNSEVRLAELTPARYQLQVGRGTMMFSQVRDSRAQVEIDTPQIAIRPKQKGAYRISVFEDHAEITVRVGQAEIFTPSGTETLDPGKTMMVRGNPSDPEFQMVNAIEQDDFDHWNAGRDQELNRSTSSRRVSPDIYGTEDMDNNGRWVNTPDYGSVWTPTVGPDWAPYHDGQWVWEDYYGWTWVSYEPWGWAPYHYGRWFFRGGIGWCWYPGPVFIPAYWSPALVAFFGFGGGFGWVPLGPFEMVHPWWGAGFYGGVGFHGALIAHANVYGAYRNARVAGGVTAVSAHDFANGRFSSTMHVSTEQLRSASLVRGQVPVAPTSASLRYSNRAATAPAHATNFSSTHFFSHSQPAAINRVPFAQQQRSLSQASGRTAGQSTGAWRPAGETASRSTSGTAAAGNSTSGWRRFGEPSTNTASRGAGSTQPSSNNGWHTSGDRPATASQPSRSQGATAGSWQRFPSSGASSGTSSARGYSSPSYGNPRSLQIAPPIVRERSASSGSSGSSSARTGTYNTSGGGSHSSGGGHSGGSGGGAGGGHGHR
ncbi:MAG TPA: DUF6600 domain-containing protein [Bryobacteraceae bacterium]|nr:DUF6600 domain-containing protein [Bryobacteraceae bacterium]